MKNKKAALYWSKGETMKKTLAMVLALCALLALASCQKAEKEVPNTPTGETETTLDLTEYRVIVPLRQKKTEESFCSKFGIGMMDKTGNVFDFTNDYIDADYPDLYYESEREILIGDTNRAESAVGKPTEKNAYRVTYVNKKIVINAENPRALEYVLNLFLETIVKQGETVIGIPELSGIFEPTEPYYDCLEGVTLTALGDSYFNYGKDNPADRWLTLLSDKYKMKLKNYGIGGSMVSDYAGDHNPMVNRLDKMSSGADIVLFEGGRNDFNQKTPMGEIDSRDTKTFAGAVNYVIDELQKKYPNALLICITTWYVGDGTEKYAETMKAVCKARNVICFDATDQALTGVYMNRESFRSQYCIRPSDVSHLNAAGMKLVLPVFEKFIGEEYRKFIENQ